MWQVVLFQFSSYRRVQELGLDSGEAGECEPNCDKENSCGKNSGAAVANGQGVLLRRVKGRRWRGAVCVRLGLGYGLGVGLV
jgi:hypothetical protein